MQSGRLAVLEWDVGGVRFSHCDPSAQGFAFIMGCVAMFVYQTIMLCGCDQCKKDRNGNCGLCARLLLGVPVVTQSAMSHRLIAMATAMGSNVANFSK